MDNTLEYGFGNFVITFDQIGGNYYRATVHGEHRSILINLIVSVNIIKRIMNNINKLPTTELSLNFFSQVFYGACLYAINGSMAE